MLVLIRGAGDLASGIACRLFRSGIKVVMTELEHPTTVRCTVAFSPAVYLGEAAVEGITARRAADVQEALYLLKLGVIPVFVAEKPPLEELRPDAFVDAVIAKKNLGTTMGDAPVVVGVGPGFSAGANCHAAVETRRGHDLGRVLYAGSPVPNTGVPGNVGGYTVERLLRAPCDGAFIPSVRIGDMVEAGQTVATVAGLPVLSAIAGVVRGLLPEGTPVHKGMKSGDVDPRGEITYCYTVSDKANAVAGGVLEAILAFRKECFFHE